VGAQRAPFREAGRPGIDISGDGRGCNTIEGLFEVKAFDVAADGTLQRLWIVYEQHCEGGESALFGEVRIGVAVPDGALVAPGIVRWPASDVGRAGAAVPVTVVAAQALRSPTRRSRARTPPTSSSASTTARAGRSRRESRVRSTCARPRPGPARARRC
jgi:hypothetical protein